MHVVATAGHVDHGKSTLVRALTGTDPDRLEEERRRGLSIELGYAWTELAGVGEVAFVDVPGHQRFLATTLAGVGPVPVALLVVAADDPWMPQAAEHLAALDALGVRHGVVVVTRADLADPAPALARARAEVDGTGLAGAPAVVVSGRTGAGLDELRQTLADVLAHVPEPDPSADVRLWVDRRFHIRGSGTVVTGTLPAGTVAVGDTLVLLGGAEARVRGLEALGRARQRMSGVARVALDLGGRAPEGIVRGTALLTPDAFLPATAVDVALRGEGRVPERPVLHLGSTLAAVHARPLGKDYYRLTLDGALPLRIGDRAILRDPGSRTLWGVTVLDPQPPALQRRGAAAARAEVLAGHDGTTAAELATRGLVRSGLLRRIGASPGPLPPGTVAAGDWLLAPSRARELRAALVALVEAAGVNGVTPAAAAHELGLPDPALVDALVEEPLRTEGGRIRSGDASLPPGLVAALEGLRAQLSAAPFAAPTAEELTALGLDAGAVAVLHRDGHVLRLAPGVVLLPDAPARATALLAGLPQPFTTSAARQALGTSRRVVLPLLAHLDAAGRTVRLPDDTRSVRGPAAGS
ncbi:selenocysteine-specific translation elongation factor [Nocardioides sp. CER19]|uniref:selenocysteine-specific translation elongation factor n=1 Tax=Nocardioides sp. CER19 TaxID=3038538 RepID=UPI00244D1C5E|nr:selenocysteine-specific translation elongation factor [Nocardioides sp. CER19]MDH2416061.1 selenocysteine-specific translation elongation factor [Nocardioides sp. CER19]